MLGLEKHLWWLLAILEELKGTVKGLCTEWDLTGSYRNRRIQAPVRLF